MLKIFSRVKVLGLSLVVAICSLVPFSASAVASYGITVSPMNERIILVPGETYKGSFKVSNSSENTGIFKYVVSVKSFYVDENYDIYYDKEENFNQIVNWIKIENPTGELPVNTVNEIKYSVKVPKDAPAGGQYAAIMVQSAEAEDVGESGAAVQLKQNVGIAHIVYAEVMGTSAHGGEIESVEVPSFILSGNISGSASITNTGNVHGVATYKLQVFPLFSDEEVYTNEEDPATVVILPSRTRYVKVGWDETPMFGIFNVVYTVEYEGVTEQVSKLVIKCPVWLLFVIITAVVALVLYFIMRTRSRRNSRRRVETE